MDLTKAIELFEELKRRISEHGDYLRESEYRTRIMLVDPLLRLLGWNVEDFHSVEIEFRTTQSANERADYVLKKGESKVAIVEAKKLGASMTPKERRQAKEYADYAEVSQCVLTDGAKWLLYDLNRGRNPDTMQPWIEFDIANDVPEQLILYSLTLWQQWFTPEVGSSPVSNFLFGSSVDNDQSETNRTTNEQQEQQPDDLPEDFNQWYSLASERRYPKHTIPMQLKIIGTDVDRRVNAWKDVIHEVVAWLIDTEKLTDNHFPIEIKENIFISREAVNRDGTPFKDPQQLPKGLTLDRRRGRPWDQWKRLRELLDQLRVDTSTIRVSHKPDVSVKRK